jgi:Peptidase family M1 domain
VKHLLERKLALAAAFATSFAAILAAARADAGRAAPVASYTIDARVNADHGLTGRETVRFTNRTRFSFDDLRLHLYLNAWKNDRSTWLLEAARGGGRPDRGLRAKDASQWGFSEIHRIALEDGTDLTPSLKYISPDDGNPDDRTLVSVALPRPVTPGETLVFRVDWEGRFPRAVARTGWKDDYLLGAQWFPKLGVATDRGWNAHQFHAATEFFADFGDYDVTLTLPKAVKGRIGATGILKDEADLPGDLVRVHFAAEDVHDFAFTACPRFEVVRDVFTAPGLPNVDILLLLQPDHRRVRDRYLKAVKAGLSDYGLRYLPYPYPMVTVVDPPWGSHTEGMEYPTLFVGGAHWLAPAAAHSPESVTVHEFGHQVFYGILASNEFEEAHLDEGFNTYATLRMLKTAFGDPSLVVRFFGLPVVFPVVLPYPVASNERYHVWEQSSRSDAADTPSYRQLDSDAVRVNAYSRTALLLASAERTFGEETWAKVMKAYATRWAFRHPTTADFLAVVREVAGDAPASAIGGIWSTAGPVDYAATSASTRRARPLTGFTGEGDARALAPAAEEAGGWESLAVVQRLGEASWPVEVELRFADGSRMRRPWVGDERWIRYRVTGPKLVAVEVDPDHKCLLDANPLNNGRLTDESPAAARRWASRLRFWAQNALELFSLLGFAGAA